MGDERVDVYSHGDKITNLILENEYKIIVELGIWKAQTIKKILKSPATKYIKEYWAMDPFKPVGSGHGRLSKISAYDDAIEIWEGVYTYATRLMLYFPQLRVIRMKSEEVAELFYQVGRQVDLVYVDADHHYLPVLSDIKCWTPLIRPGGIIAGHDYGPKYVGVRKAVDESFGDSIELDENVWIKRL
jgi:hypothetical protein